MTTSLTKPAKRRPNQMRHERVSTPELYAALEGLLPFAETEIDWLAEYVRSFPQDEDHAAEAVRARQGAESLEFAKRLIARKSYAIRRKQTALEQQRGQADA